MVWLLASSSLLLQNKRVISEVDFWPAGREKALGRSIRRRFWEISSICGLRLELEELGEGWTSPALSFAAHTQLIDPGANLDETFRQKICGKYR